MFKTSVDLPVSVNFTMILLSVTAGAGVPPICTPPPGYDPRWRKNSTFTKQFRKRNFFLNLYIQYLIMGKDNDVSVR